MSKLLPELAVKFIYSSDALESITKATHKNTFRGPAHAELHNSQDIQLALPIKTIT